MVPTTIPKLQPVVGRRPQRVLASLLIPLLLTLGLGGYVLG